MNEEQRGVLAMIREGRVLPELTTSREKLKLLNNNELASPHPWKFHQMAGGFVGHFSTFGPRPEGVPYETFHYKDF